MTFDGWTLAHQPLELWRDGQRLRLQDLPLQILDLLASRPGALVTREELIATFATRGFAHEATRYILRGELILAFRKS